MQSMAGSKVILLLGTGVAGSYLLNNPQISGLFSDISKILIKHLKENGKNGEGEGEGDSGTTAMLAAQVKRLTMELKQLAQSSSRPIIVNSGQTSSTVFSYLLPATLIGVTGYGYMWWKGIRFSDLMYVTRHGMQNAVASVSKQMESLSSALASTKRHLTGRLDVVTKTLDEGMELQGVIKQQVFEVKDELGRVGGDVENVQLLVEGLEVKMDELQSKQDFANQGIVLLCRFVTAGLEGQNKPELMQGLHAYSRTSARALSQPANMGLKELENLTQKLSSPVIENKRVLTHSASLPPSAITTDSLTQTQPLREQTQRDMHASSSSSFPQTEPPLNPSFPSSTSLADNSSRMGSMPPPQPNPYQRSFSRKYSAM